MSPLDPSSSPNRRLDTWKEIGAFFDRDERTVKRWETTRGLPVHRVPGAGRANVYAYSDELTAWLNSARVAIESEPNANSDALPTVVSARDVESAEMESEVEGDDLPEAVAHDRRAGDQPSLESKTQSLPLPLQWRAARYIAFAVVLLAVASVIVAVARHNSPLRTSRTDTTAPPRHSVDPQAEQLYLKGIYYWHKRTPEDLNQAVDYFTQAVVHDPQYAEAYVGLADCYNLLREYSLMPPSEAFPRAQAAAQRAVALDDSLSGAHSSLAFVNFYWSWDVASAQREFDRALALDPNSVNAHHWYATFLLHLGRFPESIAQIEEAQKLDPNSTSILADKGLILFYCGRTEEGVSLLKQLLASEPDFLSPHNYLAFIYRVQGDYPQYLREYRKSATLLHDESRLAIVSAAEKGFARDGARGLLTAMLKEQKIQLAKGKEEPYNLAQTCALLGEKQEALDDLQSSYQKHADAILKIRIDLSLSSLHDEPRFREMIKQIGLPALP
jgi:tetratricopeptide (TPR) repeat protein